MFVPYRTLRACSAGALLALAACSGPPPGEQARMDFRRIGFWDAPLPSEDLRLADGRIDVRGFPNPEKIELVEQARTMLARDARGFGTSSAIYFSFTGPLDPRTAEPDAAKSLAAAAPVFVVNLDDGRRAPVQVSVRTEIVPFGAPHQLAIMPQQGLPFAPGALHAAVVTRRVRDAAGRAIAVPPSLRRLLDSQRPEGLSDGAFATYRRAIDKLLAGGVARDDIAALAVFVTDRPTDGLLRMREAALARPLPAPGTLVRREVFADYCVYESTIKMPSYQLGESPYKKSGGAWGFLPDGSPIEPHLEEASLFLTVPRRPAPPAGFPLVLFVRAGGGGDRPLVDRGVHAVAGGPASQPGSGPAREFARVGWAGLSVDGPVGGRRNPTHDDEQFLVFNFFNADALRDIVRQSALELVLLAHLVPKLVVDGSDCAGQGGAAGPGRVVRFDDRTLTIMGHSTGATMAPIAVAAESKFRAAILSGAGASYVENIIYKQKPLVVRTIAEVLVGYRDVSLTETDPVLHFLQWAAEPADPQVYARSIIRARSGGAPANVLMLQGIFDHYIPPNVANAVSVPLGLDLAGEALDVGEALGAQLPIERLLGLAERRKIGYPATDNVAADDGQRATAVLAQHRGDSIEDAHEVVFQTEPPKHQYRCFLASLAKGKPTVPRPRSDSGACD